MTSRAAAARYARALFDVALKDADIEEVERELAEFSTLVSHNPALARVFANPAVPGMRKRAVIEQLIARLGDLTPAVVRLLVLLADRDHLALLDDIVQAYRARVMDYQKVVQAEITTAIPLPRDRVEVIRTSLGGATGREVRVVTRVDPAIIGGVVTRLGSIVYDGSVRRQLQRMKDRMVENV